MCVTEGGVIYRLLLDTLHLSTFVLLTIVLEHVHEALCSCHDTVPEVVPNIADSTCNRAELEKPKNDSPLFTLSAWP